MQGIVIGIHVTIIMIIIGIIIGIICCFEPFGCCGINVCCMFDMGCVTPCVGVCVQVCC